MTTSKEALVQPLEHPVRLPVFEGPLDLLLFLIRKNEIDIYDIPIEAVTRQYLDILFDMQQPNLEVAGEFFVMAATLMHIKSRMLLPKTELTSECENEDEEIDPRWELVEQLLEYKKFKDAAQRIERLMEKAQRSLPRRYKVAEDERIRRPLKRTDKLEIWNAFNRVLRRLSDRLVVGEIHDEVVTIADRMEYLLERLRFHRRFSFSSLFEDEGVTVNLVVATFLAILELTRLRKLTIEQGDAFAEIYCASCAEEPDSVQTVIPI